ncbi:MAG: Ig-like domain-containing protein, partial [Alistipes sp.]|nr:Ig-like domain-containing protein [Alistipes sp.]
MKNSTLILKTAVTLLFLGAFLTRCANIMSPEGGPKDTLPPVIVNITPGNFATNFAEKKIYIEFNEYVQIKDQNKEMFTSPQMKKMPLISTRGKGIVLTIRDTLKENTTYAIDLGSAIRDNNEGNPINAMRYVFSTGSTVDSLMCSGYTADSYKADSVSRTFLWFYIADSLPVTPEYDSTIFNRKPDVIARAQNNGIFIAQNLKPVAYRIYAFGDKNDNQMYEPGTDLVGILDTVYNPATMPPFAIWFDSLRHYPSADPQLYFRMFTDKAFKAQRLVEAKRPDCKQITLYFNTALPQIDSIRLDSIPSEKIIYDPRTKGKDTLNLWLNVAAENLPDTIKGTITYHKHDSIRQLVPTTEPLKLAWKLVETKEQQKEREKEERERKKAEEEGREYTPPQKPNP